MSLGKTENNVKDWLPADFRETSELEWFGGYFAGERFIIATWKGCTADDERLNLLARKLSVESAAGRSTNNEIPDFERAQKLAEELGLLLPSDLHKNWGGENEIWLTSTTGTWYYLTPNGELYRWLGNSNTVGGTVRSVRRLLSGPYVDGKFITALGPSGKNQGDEGLTGSKVVNPYYNNPALLTVPLFATVMTGPQLVDELSQPGKPFYPVDMTAVEFKDDIARRDATKQLTGTFFASAIPEGFAWTPQAFKEAVPEKRRSELPEFFEEFVAEVLDEEVAKRFDGDFDGLLAATTDEQTDIWYEVFERADVEPPPRQTAIILTLTKVGQEHLPYVAGRGVLGMPKGRLYELADQSGISPPPPPNLLPPPLNHLVSEPIPSGPELHVGGPPIDNVSIDEEGTITLVRLVGYCAALGLFLSYMCFRSIKITIMIFFVGVSSAMASLSLVWWGGSGMDAILMSMPSLVYVLGLSSAIHIVNYYKEEVENGGVLGAPERALAHGWGPCTLASITTAIGLLSLYTSNIIPIQKFGWFSALGVIVTLAILFTYLPAALEVFVPTFAAKKAATSRPRRMRKNQPETVGVGVLADHWEAFGRWIVNHHRLVTFTCIAVFIAAAFGIPKIKTSVQLLKLFGENARIIKDYTWLEDHFAKLVPMELVVRVPPDVQANPISETEEKEAASQLADGEKPQHNPKLSPLERMEVLVDIEKTISRAFGDAGKGIVGQAMSPAAFLPELPEPNASFLSPRRTFEEKLGKNLYALEDADMFRLERDGPYVGSELWRISLRVAALGDTDYGTFVNELRLAVNPILEAHRYRLQILDALNASENPKPYVVFLGRSQPQPVGLEPILVLPGEEQPHNFRPSKIEPERLERATVDVQAIFASVLHELMQNEAIRKQAWTGPPEPQNADRFEKSLERNLAAADVVVLVDGVQGFDDKLQELISRHPRVIDASKVSAETAQPNVVDGIPVLENSGPLQVVYTGVVPVVYKAQRTLLTSLVESIAWAFVLIAGVMVILLNPGRPVLGMFGPKSLLLGLGAGLVAMLPNAFPVIVIFGSMGHMGTLVDIGTMMTASVAMGVAVDDTIHFLSWLRRGLDSGLDRRAALIQTYRRVGPAMTQTTLVGGLGLFVFALSTFTPTQRFGTLMLVLLAAALVGDLIFLPALLAGPLGKLFKPRPNAKPVSPSPGTGSVAGDSERDFSGTVGHSPDAHGSGVEPSPQPAANTGKTNHNRRIESGREGSNKSAPPAPHSGVSEHSQAKRRGQ